jgi:hypothetical protein
MSLVVTAGFVFSADTVVFQDTTGAYNAVTNPTGYGAPNAAFADYAHYAILRKKNVNDVDDEVMTLASYSPITDYVYSADRSVDGWYEGILLLITPWTAATYPVDTVRYYAGSVYISNQSTSQVPGAGAQWDVVSDLTTIEDNSTVYAVREGRVTAFNADVYWSRQIARNSQRGHCGICEDDRTKERLDRIYTTIQQAVVADSLGDNTEGEWCVLKLQLLAAK